MNFVKDQTYYDTRRKASQFMSRAVSDYKSTRVLYLTNNLYSAGFMAHEAIEKAMKAVIYFYDPSLNFNSIHNLKKLKGKLHYHCGIDISYLDEIIEFIEESYSFRYPDGHSPKSFATATNRIHWVDLLFITVHDAYLYAIPDQYIRLKSGVFSLASAFFEDSLFDNKYHLLDRNEVISIETFEFAKNYWHDLGFFKKSSQGVTRYP